MTTPRVTRACERPGCQKTFSWPPRSKQKYCCEACGDAARKEAERQREKDAFLAAAAAAPDPLADVWQDRQFNPFGEVA